MDLSAAEMVLLVAQLVASLLGGGVGLLRSAEVLSGPWPKALGFFATVGVVVTTVYLTSTLDWRSLIIPSTVTAVCAAIDGYCRLSRRRRGALNELVGVTGAEGGLLAPATLSPPEGDKHEEQT